MAKTKTIAVFGLGSMGFGMASSILNEGHEVWGFDVAKEPVDRFIAIGGLHGDVRDVLPSVDIVLLVVLNAAQTEVVLFEQEKGIAQYLKESTVVISCATVAPDFARQMSDRCQLLNLLYLDAPISGGSVKAAKGQLSVMASGSDSAFVQSEQILECIAERVFMLGDQAGSGSAMKAINQLLAGVHIASMAEAVTFGMTQGVEPEKIVHVISQCAGSSWMFENRAPHIVSGDYTPHSAVNIWLKDLGIVLDIADQAKFTAPLTTAALQQFIEASEQGLGQEDDAAVAKVYAKKANIQLPSSV